MEDVTFDSIEGKGCQSVDVSQSHNASNAFYWSNKSYLINKCTHESDCRDFPCLNATSEVNLIAQEDLCYMDKAVTDVKQMQFSVLPSTSTVKDISIDEGFQTFEKALVKYHEIDEEFFTSSSFPSIKGSSMLTDEITEKDKLEDLKPLSTINGLVSLAEILQVDVGDGENPDPSRCAKELNISSHKTVQTDLSFFLVNEYPAEQEYSGNSIRERRQLDTEERVTCIPSEGIIEPISSEETIEPALNFTKADFSQVCSSNHIESAAENQGLRQKTDQVLEEEDLIGVVSDSNDLFNDKMSTFSDTMPNRIDNTKISSVYVKLHDVVSTSDLKAGDTSIVGNKDNVINNQPSVLSQNDVENEESVIDGTIEARTSFTHLMHGDLNQLEPSIFSGSISSSTHIPYSGSISFQSESSTTSAHSFAFPILQSEWSNSPVRMAEANRRHLRKRGWKKKLLCCKF